MSDSVHPEAELKAFDGSVRFVFRHHLAGDSREYSLLGFEVYVAAYAFNGMANCEFYLPEFKRFVAQLTSVYERVGGEAELRSECEEFTMLVRMESDGHARVEGILKRSIHEPTALQYELVLDQSYFREFLDGLRGVVSYL